MDCDGNKEGNGDGDEGGRQVRAMTKKAMATEATAMAMTMRVAGD